ncbi:general stress protein [Salmonella enterica subsp. enterica]|nr:general stress protein [Salmonella enterica subsp. enterica]
MRIILWQNNRGGSGNFAEDKEKASEAGRKGGQHSGGTLKRPTAYPEAGKKGGQNSYSGGRKSGN